MSDEFDDLLNELDDAPAKRAAPMTAIEERAERRRTVRDVQRLMAVFLKAGKTLRLYTEGSEHRFFNQFTDEFIERLDNLLQAREALTLEITPYSINWDGDPVFENQEQRENLAFKLYRDGVRLLQYRRGVDQEELRDFVTLIAREVDTRSGNKDLSVLFWEADFKHIHMAIAETFVEYSAEAVKVLEDIDAQLERHERAFDLKIVEGRIGEYEPVAFKRVDEEGGEGEDVEDTEALPDLLAGVFDDVHMEAIYEDLHGLEDPYATFEEVGTVIAEVVLTETDPEELRLFLKHVDDALSPLLATAAVGPLNSVLRRLALLTRSAEEEDTALAEPLRNFFLSFCDADRLSLLSRAINTDWDSALKGELFCFVSLQHPLAREALMAFLGQVVLLEARRTISDALLLLLARQSGPWIEALRSQNWHVAADAVYALGRLADPTSLDPIVGAFAREEFQVRIEVINALREHQSPRIHRLMLDALRDDHKDVRLAALRYLTVYRIQDAVPVITKALGSKSFTEREFDERRGWYIALGHLAGGRALQAFIREADAGRDQVEADDGVHLALLGIKAIKTPEARRYLEGFVRTARGDMGLMARRLLSTKRNTAKGG